MEREVEGLEVPVLQSDPVLIRPLDEGPADRLLEDREHDWSQKFWPLSVRLMALGHSGGTIVVGSGCCSGRDQALAVGAGPLVGIAPVSGSV